MEKHGGTEMHGDALWVALRNLGLFMVPPGRDGALWLARTVGGTHDELRLSGSGATPEAAVEECVRQWEEQRRTERLLG